MPRLHCINKIVQPIVLAQYALRKLNRAVVSRCFIVIVDLSEKISISNIMINKLIETG